MKGRSSARVPETVSMQSSMAGHRLMTIYVHHLT